MTDLSIVVPVYFNQDSLRPLHERLCAMVAGSLPGLAVEFVFVDDGSGDRSFEVLKKLSKADRRVRIVRLSRNFGSNAAILAGLAHSNGKAIVNISADLQDPPETIPEMVNAWREGGEVVLAARRRRDEPLFTRLTSALSNRMFRAFLFKDFPKDGFDMMLLDRRVADLLVGMSEKNSYLFGQALWVGFNRKTVYYDRAKRAQGRSRWTFSRKLKYFIDIFVAFSYLPLRLAAFSGIILGLGGVAYSAVVLWLRLSGRVPIPGWASLTIIVLMTAGMQLTLLGIYGEYMWRALDETRKRSPFIVAELVGDPGTEEPEGVPGGGVLPG